MQTITTIGHDIAKSVFQAHGVDVAVDIPYLEWLYKELGLQVILPVRGAPTPYLSGTLRWRPVCGLARALLARDHKDGGRHYLIGLKSRSCRNAGLSA